MKTLLTRDLESGYKIVVVLIDESGPLAVRLDNSKDDFVGQIFASFDSLKENVSRLSNFTLELSDADLKDIEQAVVKSSTIEVPKHESASALGKMTSRRDRVNSRLKKFTS